MVEIPIPYLPQEITKNGYIELTDIPDEPPIVPEAYAGDIAIVPEIFFQKAINIILTTRFRARFTKSPVSGSERS